MGKRQTIQRGLASAASPLMSELLKRDSHGAEPALLQEGNHYPEEGGMPVDWYFDPAFAEIEREKVWLRSWQVVGRGEDIPEVGDRMTYDVGDLSYIIVRAGPKEFRAFENSCRHRGTRMCHGASSADSIRCPFHGWRWALNGELESMPGAWDFRHADLNELRLVEAQISSWEGYLFINPDREAAPLSESLGILQSHFEDAPGEPRQTVLNVRIKVRANWKVALEAFLEAYHVFETHPQALSFNGDETSQYDVWDDGKSHVSRAVFPVGVPSTHLGDDASPRAAAQSLVDTLTLSTDAGLVLEEVSSPFEARAAIAKWRRATMGEMTGRDVEQISDSAMVDATQYFVWPNFCPWWGEGQPLMYSFRPYGNNPEESLVEVRLFASLSKDASDIEAAEPIEVDFDTRVTTVPELSAFKGFFDVLEQDLANIPHVQRGMRSRACRQGKFLYADYQEMRIRHFHEVLRKKVAQ